MNKGFFVSPPMPILYFEKLKVASNCADKKLSGAVWGTENKNTSFSFWYQLEKKQIELTVKWMYIAKPILY